MPKTTKRTVKKGKVSMKNKKQSFFSVLARNRLTVFVVIFALIGGVFFLYRSSAQTVSCRDKILSRKTGGNEKNCVTYLQTALNLHGYDPVDFSGVFTGNTEAAVRAFQIDRKNSGLVMDGIVGPQTAAHICWDGINSNGHNVSKYNFCTADQRSQLSSAVPNSSAVNTVSIQQYGSGSYTSIVNRNTQITNTGGKVQIGNTSSNTSTGSTLPNLPNIDLSKLLNLGGKSNKPATVVNTQQQIDSTGGNIVVNKTSTGCSIVTLNNPFNGASQSYNSCDTKSPAVTNISKTVNQPTPTKSTPKSEENEEVSVPKDATSTPIPVTSDPLPVSQSECPSQDALQVGASGDCVRRLQDLLNIRSGAGINVTGEFDLKTKLALITYQLKNRLAGNGSVTKQLWGILEGTRPTTGTPDAPTTPTSTTPTTAPESTSPSTTPAPQTPETTPTPPPQEQTSTGTTSSLPTGTNCINTILKIGSTDTECIKEAQAKLVARGFSNQPVDGIFSEKTEDSVVNLRLQHTIVPCISGVIDRYVWYVLNDHPDDPYSSCSDPVDQQPSTPTVPETPATPETPTTPEPDQPPVPAPSPQVPAPSAAYELGEDSKIFTYSFRMLGIRSVRVCVAVAPTKPGQSSPNTVTTTSGKKIRLTSLPLLIGKKAKVGCTIDSFSRRSSSKEYKVKLADHWVSVYGIKLN